MRVVAIVAVALFACGGGDETACPEGLVDFPSRLDGRTVFLCWRLGEPEVLHWHELDAGFAGRQPLVAGSVADGPGDTFELD